MHSDRSPLFPYKALGGPVCDLQRQWGQDVNASNLFKGNEVSVAVVNPNYEEVCKNGRGQQFSWGQTNREVFQP